MSTWLINEFSVGDSVSVSEPLGDFTINRVPKAKNIIMASAGCGIIPLVAIMKSYLISGGGANIEFIHCERSDRKIIFLDELLKLEREHENLTLRFYVKSTTSKKLRASTERLSTENMQSACANPKETTVLLCGPERFINKTRFDLTSIGVNQESVIVEQYGDDEPKIKATGDIFVTIPNFNIKIMVKKGDNLAEILMGINAPISTALCSSKQSKHRCMVDIRNNRGGPLTTVNSCQYQLSSSTDIFIV
jgi:ferredoxin-NADP reductase